MTDFRDHTKGSRLMGERRQIIGLRRNGAEFPTEASIACVSLGGETAYVVVLRDITERTLAEQQTARLGRIIEQSINEIYVSLATDTNWGADRLGQNVLPAGQSFAISLPVGDCVYDIRVVYTDNWAA